MWGTVKGNHIETLPHDQNKLFLKNLVISAPLSYELGTRYTSESHCLVLREDFNFGIKYQFYSSL